MNRPIPRADLERFSASLAEKRRRIAKAEHQTRGYRDEDGVWQGGLLSFVRYFWHVLEPGTKFVDGWVPEAICEHLEAVTYGEITNLLINVFPGATKSLFTNVFWPAWEWGPMDLAHLRYVTFSYSSSNTERDNQRFGDLISSPDFQAMYPAVAIRQRGMTMISNQKHGWKWASSVSGSATGKRGNRAICFPADQLVQTEFGPRPISDIVEKQQQIRVWSYNRSSGGMELRSISAWHKNPGRRLIKITLSDGHSVTCTEDHPILGEAGYLKASNLRIGQFLRCAQFITGRQTKMAPSSAMADVVNGCTLNAKFLGKKAGAFIGSVRNVLNVCFGKLGQPVFVRGAFGPSTPVVGLQFEIEMSPYSSGADASNCTGAYVEFDSEILCKPIRLTDNRSNHFLSKVGSTVSECPVTFTIGNILRPSSILKIIKSRITSVSVFMTDFLSCGARTNEGSGNQRVGVPVESFPLSSKRDTGVSLNERPSHDFPRHDHLVATSYDDSGQALDSSEIRNFVVFEADHGTPYLACITSVEYVHDIPSVTYCLTVQGNHNLVCGSGASVICSNCDDLNNVKESESKTVMDETNRWFRESLSSRLNNMETDAKVVIAQRVGEGDVSGEILRLGLPYCHLCIPMEFVWQADENGDPYTTQIGWVDPRWRPDKDDCEGELAWPARFSEKSVQSLKVELGPFATASQLQQTPEARGGGLIKREWWMPGEVYMTNDGQKFPPFEYLVASLDGAYTEDEKNDPSALVVLGVFTNEHGYNRAMLVHAWDKRLEFSGPRIEVQPGEHESMYRRRAMPHWGLIEWVADTCKRFKVDKLLIESKASGISAAQSLRNSHGREGWVIQLVEPKGDKYARGLAVQSSFSQEMIYAPDRDWATKVIDNCAIFPYGAHDDLYDAMMQAVKHLRDTGLIRSDEERRAQEVDAVRHRGAPKAPLYPGMRARSA